MSRQHEPNPHFLPRDYRQHQTGPPPPGPPPPLLPHHSTQSPPQPHQGSNLPGQHPHHSTRHNQPLRQLGRGKTNPITWLIGVFCALFWVIIIVGGLAILIVYLIFRPRSPKFDVSTATLNVAYLDMGYLLNGDLTLLANFTNPNKKVKVDFSYVIVDLYHENALLATRYVEPFSVMNMESRFMNVHMVSSQVPLSIAQSQNLKRQMDSNRVRFEVKGLFRTRSNLGGFLRYSYWLYGHCTIVVTGPPSGVLLSPGSPVDLSEKLLSLTANITCRVAFGKSFEGSGFDSDRFQEIIHEAMVMLGSRSASDFFPYVGWIIDWLTGFRGRLDRSFHELDVFYQRVIDDHLNPGRLKQEQEDIVDILLRIESDETEFGAVQLTKDHIKAILMNIFLAGVDTGTITMVWAMSELARRPRLMQKAQDEIRDCVGKRGRVTENDLDQLHFLKMVGRELVISA
ncbi:hypothetical protein F0562_034243 [Nyssa sinensis]|uniref:Late embryogenesis abundant protein LEA-2 subgroup domain-containing protein n=1 Tax=Nyssa sinensis TaxID=561372 RepID=A0A5J5AJI5_9ASTE|nr:hypothetical protein F0562_034243 [Nyssa sinensis]